MTVLRMISEIVDDTLYRRYPCSSGYHYKLFSPIIFRKEPVAVRASHKKAFPFLVFKDFIGHFSHFPDGQIYIVISNAADRDGSLSVFWNRDFKELARLYLPYIAVWRMTFWIRDKKGI